MNIKMYKETREQIDSDLWRVLKFANENEELHKMCRVCEEWCGQEHDYNECVNKPCFTFFRCYEFLDYLNGWI